MLLGTNMSQEGSSFHNEKKIYIIDSHSHFGKDNFWLNYGDPHNYINYNHCDINEVFSMSVPCPVIMNKDGSKTILSYYEIIGKDIKHYKVNEKINGDKIYIPNKLGNNPYKKSNDYIYNLCMQNNELKFNFVPIIHPYYYSYDDLLEHINRGAKMFKIHGVACGVIPQKINKEFFEILEYLKIPIIIHTDFSNQENVLSYNSAFNWLECLKKYDIKSYFAHAARLSEKCIDIINKDNRYVVGIGPDMMLSIDGYTEQKTNNYLEYCFDRFDIDKLIFDIDYPWNTKDINNYEYDWNAIKRIEMLGLSFEEKSKILSKNIKKFIKER